MDQVIKAKFVAPVPGQSSEHGISVTLKNGATTHFPTEDIAHVTFHAGYDDLDVRMDQPEIVAEEAAPFEGPPQELSPEQMQRAVETIAAASPPKA